MSDIRTFEAPLTANVTTGIPSVGRHRLSSWASRLGQPLSQWWCALGWFVSTAIFVGMTRLVGGVTTGDASDSVNTTWALAHGLPSCSYAYDSGIGPRRSNR
jgi:hypothetical protein